MSYALFIDANLSTRIPRRIEDLYPGSHHMFSTSLAINASDIDIWNYAKDAKLPVVLTYDEDFKHLAERLGPPPKVILLRIYDQRTATVVDLLKESQSVIESFLEDDDSEVLELRGGA